MSKLTPLPGQIVATPYIPENKVFIPIKEEVGEDQTSVVVAVGGDYVDDGGNSRTSPVKVGDVIVHRYAQDTFQLDEELYRIIPFYQVFVKLG